MAAPAAGARYVCMTLFDAEGVGLNEAHTHWEALPTAEPAALRYLIWQRELCPRTHRLHLQAYAEFRRPMRWPAVKALFGASTLHLEARLRSRDEAREYCRKADSRVTGPWEIGEWTGGQGTRTDVAAFVDFVLTGADDLDIASAHPGLFCRSLRAIDRLRSAKMKRDLPAVRRVAVYNLFGETGVGKTWTAMVRGGDSMYRLPFSTTGVWLDGYEGEKTLIIEDFCGGIPFRLLLQMLDGYKTQSAVKCGFTWGGWDTVIITSDAPPECWYTKNEHCVNAFPQLLRRFDHGAIKHMAFDETEAVPAPMPVGWRRRVITTDHVCVPPVYVPPVVVHNYGGGMF